MMQRLGMPDDRIFAFVSENEIEIEELQKEIISLNVKYSRTSEDEADLIKKKLLEKIDILKKKTDDDDNLIRQFIMRIEFGLNKEKSIDDQIAGIIENIKITNHKFSIDNIVNGLYMFEEVKLINLLAGFYNIKGEKVKAVEIMSQLYQYVKKHFGEVPERAHFPLVALNYSKALENIGQFSESLKIAEEGRRVCIDYGLYENVGGLIEEIAKDDYSTGDVSECESMLYQAYYLHKLTDNNRGIERVKKLMQEYGIDTCALH